MIFNLNSFTQKGSGKNNLFLISLIVFIFIFFICIMPYIEKCYNDESKELVEKIENIMGIKINTNKCSRSCCINSGWPLPKELQSTDISPDELKNYIPNNFSCNLGSNIGRSGSNGSGSGGCVCVTKNDYEFLGSRGNNAIDEKDN
jgi:hypothetical protein